MLGSLTDCFVWFGLVFGSGEEKRGIGFPKRGKEKDPGAEQSESYVLLSFLPLF
jgi:hypothetical protein